MPSLRTLKNTEGTGAYSLIFVKHFPNLRIQPNSQGPILGPEEYYCQFNEQHRYTYIFYSNKLKQLKLEKVKDYTSEDLNPNYSFQPKMLTGVWKS